LQQGLAEDEKGRKDEAIPLYTDAAEICLKAVSVHNVQYLLFDFKILNI
jgi:hypothetical protein